MNLAFGIFQTGSQANGGVESITQILEPLCRKHSIVIFTNLESPICDRWRIAGARVVLISGVSMGVSFWRGGVFCFIGRFFSLLRANSLVVFYSLRFKINLFHCNDPAPFLYLAFSACLLRKPLVFNLRDTKAVGEAINWRKYRFYFKHSDRVIVLSDEMKRYYEKFTDRPEKIVRVYSAVDSLKFFPADSEEKSRLRAKLGIAQDQRAVGFVAAFSDKKNQLNFIREAGSRWHETLPDVSLYFVGDFDPDAKDYDKACLKATEESGLSTIFHFAGYSAAIADWYRCLDLVVVPTRKEGLARCMIESLSSGTPVVSFDVTSAHEILTGFETGIVVSQGDYAAMVFAIKSCLAKEPAELEELSLRCTRVAKRFFTSADIVDQCENLYLEFSQSPV